MSDARVFTRGDALLVASASPSGPPWLGAARRRGCAWVAFAASGAPLGACASADEAVARVVEAASAPPAPPRTSPPDYPARRIVGAGHPLHLEPSRAFGYRRRTKREDDECENDDAEAAE